MGFLERKSQKGFVKSSGLEERVREAVDANWTGVVWVLAEVGRWGRLMMLAEAEVERMGFALVMLEEAGV